MRKFHLMLSLLLILSVSLACRISSATRNDGPRSILQSTSTPDVVPPVAREAPGGFLQNTLRDRMLSTPVRITIQEVSTAKTVDYLVEFQPPDRFHVIVSGAVEAILLGPDMYVVAGSWDRVRLSNVLLYAGAFSQSGEQVAASISNVKFERVEFLDKKPLLVFTFTAQARVGPYESISSNTLWVWALSTQAHKLISISEDGELRSTTTASFEYDESITIEPPN